MSDLPLSWRHRLPMLYQTEAAECGLACLAMVAGFYGHHTSVAQLRKRAGFSLRGANLERLVCVATALQLRTRAIRIEVDDLRKIATPCILHWDMTHFVVLESARRNGATIHDPAFGIRRLGWAEVSRSFTGIALEASPTADFAPKAAPPAVSLSQLAGPIRGLKATLAQILLLSVGIQAVLLAAPFLMQWTIDHVVPSSDAALLSLLGISFLLLLLIQVALGATRGWALAYLSATLRIQWNANVLAHLLRLPLEFFQKRHLGDIVSRSSSVNAIQRTITSSFVEAAIDGAMALLTLALMLVYSGTLTVAVLAALGLYILVRTLSFRLLRSETEQQVISSARQQTHFLETLRGLQTIRISNTQGSRLADWYNLMVGTSNHEFRVSRLNVLFSSSNLLLFGAERIAVIWIGAGMVLGGGLSVGMLVAFLAYREQFAMRVASLVDKVMEFRMMRMHCERLADIVLSAPEPPCEPLDDEVRHPLDIEVDDVSFRYSEGEPWILKNCSFRVEAGEALALVGASGCGKTTLLKLMLGLLEPTSGTIRFAGRYSAGQVRGHVAAVMQDDVLFGGTIADNIALFSPSADRQRVVDVALMAGIDADIKAMPMGYDTLVGDMGAALSGGQKQRVLLARALYQGPKVLFLDEATSHLDLERERTVNEAVSEIPTTRIIVAHRPDTIASADRVLHVRGGRVFEDSQRPPCAPAQRERSADAAYAS